MLSLSKYKTWLFDCDGVILNSNRLKTDAFYQTALMYGEKPAVALVDYHRRHGGISRFEKASYFFKEILEVEPSDREMKDFLGGFAQAVRSGLLTCGMDEAFPHIVALMPDATRRFVVSGGAQDELRDIFSQREIDVYFDAIFGSPDTKAQIVKREAERGELVAPTVFVGDAALDYETALLIGADFIFVTHWTDFDDWSAYFEGKPVRIVSSLSCLAESWSS